MSDDRTAHPSPEQATPEQGTSQQTERGDHEREPLEEIADRTSERVQPDDPYTEPPNSTVDDWIGQRVARDAERLEADDS